MKKTALFFTIMLSACAVMAQPKPVRKPGNNKNVPAQPDMNKMLDDAIKAEGMSKEDQEEMKKMMGGMLPSIVSKPEAAPTDFKNNRVLIPPRNTARIAAIPNPVLNTAGLKSYQQQLFTKLMTHIPADQKRLMLMVSGKTQDPKQLMSAATIAFMQGHNPAAIGLALQAFEKAPADPVIRNNIAAILSQSGYGDKAIPFLRQLALEFPDNATVFHNTGYAWLSLGAADSAKKYIEKAMQLNPENPETQLCRGLLEELSGNQFHAADYYVAGYQKAPNDMAEKMATNSNAGAKLQEVSFDELKKMITIHEYFPKNWAVFPVLTDDVKYYELNMRTKNGFKKMSESLEKELKDSIERTDQEMDELSKKGDIVFARDMMTASIKGVNLFSKPALYIIGILSAYQARWTMNFYAELNNMQISLQQKYEEMTRPGNNDKCTDIDRTNNSFLIYANPVVRNFYAKKLEEYRVWLNAWCTWTWYLAGNPKQSIRSQCLNWAYSLTEMRADAVDKQFTFPQNCINQKGDDTLFIKAPDFPDFACPAKVSMPLGMEKIILTANTTGLNENSFGISMRQGSNMPSVTFSMVTSADIPEPGKYGQPFFKTTASGITPVGINHLSPLSVNDDPSFKKTIGKRPDPDQKKKAFYRSVLLREILTKNINLECTVAQKKPSFKWTIGDVEFSDLTSSVIWDPVNQQWVRAWHELTTNEAGEPMELRSVFKSGLKLEFGNIEFDESPYLPDDVEFEEKGILKTLLDLKINELQTVITNGLELSDKISRFIPGLFD